jgi:hypothetical protein
MMAADYTQPAVIIGLIILVHVVTFAIVMIRRAIRRHNSHLEAQRRYHSIRRPRRFKPPYHP